MKKLSTKKLNDLIQRNNKVFKNASRAEKRVLIAKDVLTQLRYKRYEAQRGLYLEFNEKYELKDSDGLREKFLGKEIETCQVCAKGAIFVSCTNFNNNVKIKEVQGLDPDYQSFKNGFKTIFTQYQLDLMEKAFEAWKEEDGSSDITKKDKEFTKANNFCVSLNSEERMKAIMKNIIANNGTFKP